jgi:hypothetical protein
MPSRRMIAGIFYLLFTPRGWKFAGYQNDWRR